MQRSINKSVNIYLMASLFQMLNIWSPFQGAYILGNHLMQVKRRQPTYLYPPGAQRRDHLCLCKHPLFPSVSLWGCLRRPGMSPGKTETLGNASLTLWLISRWFLGILNVHSKSQTGQLHIYVLHGGIQTCCVQMLTIYKVTSLWL